jgi:hypothetical protein
MFALMVEYMREAQGIQRPMDVSTIPILPAWMNKEETVGT